jgi:hypothetical protein
MKELYGKGQLMDPVVIEARLEYLQARAEFDGPESPVFLRVGEDERMLYVDLCEILLTFNNSHSIRQPAKNGDPVESHHINSEQK